ncbi:hypothetical protein BJX99DRAFT_256057 [Aspergillus californicus]
MDCSRGDCTDAARTKRMFIGVGLVAAAILVFLIYICALRYHVHRKYGEYAKSRREMIREIARQGRAKLAEEPRLREPAIEIDELPGAEPPAKPESAVIRE